jgi:U3 small nucleolar RNA-associated protein 12
MLPFSDALRLLTYLPEWLQQHAGGAHAELSCRTAVLLLRLHHAQLIATAGARHVLLKLRRYLRPAVQALKDTMGFNAAGLRHIQRLVKERTSMMGDD